jgi:hypothetical protein
LTADLKLGFYFPVFVVPAFPGFPAYLKFPFPGENGREYREIKHDSFYFISTSNFPDFDILYNLFIMMAKIMPRLAIYIPDEF